MATVLCALLACASLHTVDTARCAAPRSEIAAQQRRFGYRSSISRWSSAVIAEWSMTQGASMRSKRSAARGPAGPLHFNQMQTISEMRLLRLEWNRL